MQKRRLVQPLEPIQARSANEQIYERLRGAILSGVLAPGRRLVEDDLARELSASRTPVREALIMLEFEGLAQRSRRGLEVRTFTRQELSDIYEIRGLLEGRLVEQAVEHMTQADAAELAAICDEAERRWAAGFEDRAEQVWWLVQSNRRFHGRIAQVASNHKLVAMVHDVSDLPLLYKAFFWLSPDHVRLSLHYHRTIAQTAADRDRERAGLVMREHIFDARDLMLHYMDSSSDQEREDLLALLQAWISAQVGADESRRS